MKQWTGKDIHQAFRCFAAAQAVSWSRLSKAAQARYDSMAHDVNLSPQAVQSGSALYNVLSAQFPFAALDWKNLPVEHHRLFEHMAEWLRKTGAV